jgi:hypothetical protein
MFTSEDWPYTTLAIVGSSMRSHPRIWSCCGMLMGPLGSWAKACLGRYAGMSLFRISIWKAVRDPKCQGVVICTLESAVKSLVQHFGVHPLCGGKSLRSLLKWLLQATCLAQLHFMQSLCFLLAHFTTCCSSPLWQWSLVHWTIRKGPRHVQGSCPRFFQEGTDAVELQGSCYCPSCK